MENADELRLAHMVEDLAHTYGPRDPNVRHDFRVRLWVLLDKTRAVAQAPLIKALTNVAMQPPIHMLDNRPIQLVEETKNLPKTKAVTLFEGDNWIPFIPGEVIKHVHAIKFDDGSVWDSCNGWRHLTPDGG